MMTRHLEQFPGMDPQRSPWHIRGPGIGDASPRAGDGRSSRRTTSMSGRAARVVGKRVGARPARLRTCRSRSKTFATPGSTATFSSSAMVSATALVQTCSAMEGPRRGASRQCWRPPRVHDTHSLQGAAQTSGDDKHAHFAGRSVQKPNRFCCSSKVLLGLWLDS